MRIVPLALFLAAALCLIPCAVAPCFAATWTVTTNADDGSVDSLRGVVASADSGDIISFNLGDEATIALSSDLGQLEISKDLTIQGPGSDDLAINGGGVCRVFYISECSVNISDLSIVSGDASSNSGGGIYCQSASLTLENCAFSGNTAYNNGGGIYNESISADIINCTFSGNTTDYWGGGIYSKYTSADITNCTFDGNTAVAGASIYNYETSASVRQCTFSDNTAAKGSGIGSWGGGMYNQYSSMDISGCTFSGNIADASCGGAVHNDNTSADIINCTFSENTATMYGGGAVFTYYPNTANITNCTFVGNDIATKYGSGITLAGDSAPVVVWNCILWDKGSLDVYTNNAYGMGEITLSHCIVSGDISGDISVDLGTVISDDPMLDDLADNGGDTKTCALLSGSPAIDTGMTIDEVTTDQRGVSRPQGNGYDIGAYEVKENTGSSGCSIGYISPAALLLFAPLWFLRGKK